MGKWDDSLSKSTCEPLAELGAHWALPSLICCSDGDNKLISTEDLPQIITCAMLRILQTIICNEYITYIIFNVMYVMII